jgi:acyl-CoA thioesterase-1
MIGSSACRFLDLSSVISTMLFAFFMMFLPTAAATETILVIGDSISAGYGLETIDQGWVALLQEKLIREGRAEKVVNASISGDTTAGGLLRIDQALKRYKPSIVIIELGGNDGLRGLPPHEMKANLGAMIERSQNAGARVLLLGMRIPPNYGRRYTELFNRVYLDLAERHGIPYVPFFLEGVAMEKNLMQADAIHPAREAQPVMLKLVWEKLHPMLKS